MLRVRDLVVSIEGTTIVGPLSFDVAPGEAIAVTGTHGAGKTTLLMALAGVLPASGSIEIDPDRATDGGAGAVSWMSPTPVFEPGRSLAELVEATRADGGDGLADARVDELYDVLGLGARRHDPPAILSRGLRQRAALLLEIVRPTPLLCLDEPLAGVELRARDTVIDVLLDACAAGRSALVATHDTDVVARLHREILLVDGRIAADTGPT